MRNLVVLTLTLLLGVIAVYSAAVIKGNNFISKSTTMKELPADVAATLPTISSSSSFRVPILLYHYIEVVKDEKDTIRKSLSVIPPVFEEQVKTLKEAGYTFITPSRLADIFDDKQRLPKKPLILSFDDGYRDFYTDAFPILKKYKIKSVVYLVPAFLDKPNNMTSVQVKDLIDSGLVEIGAHTISHVHLKGLDEKRVKEEIVRGKTMLEEAFNIRIVSFAYPYGEFDLKTIQVVKEAGFTTAASTIEGTAQTKEERYFLSRLRPGYKTGQELLKILEKM